jgi:hypothetical protein
MMTRIDVSGAGRASTPDSDPDSPNIDPSDFQADHAPPSPIIDPLPPDQSGRSKAVASIPDISPAHVLAKISAPVSNSTADFVQNIRDRYIIPDGILADGVVSDEYRVGMNLKRRADAIARSHCIIITVRDLFNFHQIRPS